MDGTDYVVTWTGKSLRFNSHLASYAAPDGSWIFTAYDAQGGVVGGVGATGGPIELAMNAGRLTVSAAWCGRFQDVHTAGGLGAACRRHANGAGDVPRGVCGWRPGSWAMRAQTPPPTFTDRPAARADDRRQAAARRRTEGRGRRLARALRPVSGLRGPMRATVARTTPIRAVHLSQLRAALAEVCAVAGEAGPSLD